MMWQEMFFKIRVIWDIIGFIILALFIGIFILLELTVRIEDWNYNRKRRKRK